MAGKFFLAAGKRPLGGGPMRSDTGHEAQVVGPDHLLSDGGSSLRPLRNARPSFAQAECLPGIWGNKAGHGNKQFITGYCVYVFRKGRLWFSQW
jgi:hypothetical protein